MPLSPRRLAAFSAAVPAAAVAGLGAAATENGPRSAGGGREMLPDLDQAVPGRLVVTRSAGDRPRFLLGFASAVANVGEGPLLVVSRRGSRAEPSMRPSQVIWLSGGAVRRQRVRGIVRYVHSETHAHWHLLGFDRYELRSAGRPGTRLRDRKTGFCLGDRYLVRRPLAARAARAAFRTECGKGQPSLLSLRQGISVGYGDDYKPTLEGQHFDVTRLPPGRYLLVHRANPERALRELDYANNAASLLFRLAWPGGAGRPPRITVLGRCPDTPRCPP